MLLPCQREHAIEALNAKVVELQGIVARLLQEKGGHPGSVNKSIIEFNTQLSLSEHMVCWQRAYQCTITEQCVCRTPI